MIICLILSALAYLIGSLSSAVIVARLLNLPDPRLAGSGNPGATNMLRIGGKVPAILTLLGDLSKGALPVILANYMHLGAFGVTFVGLAAFLGHLFPLFFHFQGGKGVATMFGIYLAAFPTLAITMAIVWLLVAIASRYSSLAALIASSVGLLGVLCWHTSAFLPILLLTIGIFIRHLDNIQRLRLGTENKINW